MQSFTLEMKALSMSQEVETKIEGFLEEMLYLNPFSEIHILEQFRSSKRNKEYGKIKRETNRVTDQEEWKLLEKSLEKLKEANNRSRSPAIKKNYDNNDSLEHGLHQRSMFDRRTD